MFNPPNPFHYVVHNSPILQRWTATGHTDFTCAGDPRFTRHTRWWNAEGLKNGGDCHATITCLVKSANQWQLVQSICRNLNKLTPTHVLVTCWSRDSREAVLKQAQKSTQAAQATTKSVIWIRAVVSCAQMLGAIKTAINAPARSMFDQNCWHLPCCFHGWNQAFALCMKSNCRNQKWDG
jgi:hypothetical protein